MPALDALLDRLTAAHTLPCGISVDSKFSHAAFGEQLGGIRFPLLADFHPKGAVSKAFGAYKDAAGISARATVLVDAGGIVRYAEVADGHRDMAALAERCEALPSDGLPPTDAAAGLPDDVRLFVKEPCTFSRWTLAARQNLGLASTLPVVNVSTDPRGMAELQVQGGKTQAPALWMDGAMRYESSDIVAALVERTGLRW